MKYEISFKAEKKDKMIENLKHAIELLESETEEEENDPVCNGDCENCENYVEENDPEEVFEDLNQTIACLLYYDIEIPVQLILKYNKARRELNVKEYYKNADNKNS